MDLNFSSKGKVLSADVWPVTYFCSCVDTVCKQWTECTSITQTSRDSPSITEYTTFWRPTVTLKVSTHTHCSGPFFFLNIQSFLTEKKREMCRSSVKSTRILSLQFILHVKSLHATVMDRGIRILTQIRQATDNKTFSDVPCLLPSL